MDIDPILEKILVLKDKQSTSVRVTVVKIDNKKGIEVRYRYYCWRFKQVCKSKNQKKSSISPGNLKNTIQLKVIRMNEKY